MGHGDKQTSESKYRRATDINKIVEKKKTRVLLSLQALLASLSSTVTPLPSPQAFGFHGLRSK